MTIKTVKEALVDLDKAESDALRAKVVMVNAENAYLTKEDARERAFDEYLDAKKLQWEEAERGIS